jgi:hypothetical protein
MKALPTDAAGKLEYLCESPNTRLTHLHNLIEDKQHLIVQHKDGMTNFVVPAKDKKADRIVLTAHHDIIRGSYGYNDNGTGLVALLQLQGKLPDNCELVFTDQEESGYRGASMYLEMRPHPIQLNINLDIVGVPDSVYYKIYGDIDFGLTDAHRLDSLPFNDSVAFDRVDIPSVILMTGPTPRSAATSWDFVGRIWTYQHCGMDDTRDGIKKLDMAMLDLVGHKARRIIEMVGEAGMEGRLPQAPVTTDSKPTCVHGKAYTEYCRVCDSSLHNEIDQ